MRSLQAIIQTAMIRAIVWKRKKVWRTYFSNNRGFDLTLLKTITELRYRQTLRARDSSQKWVPQKLDNSKTKCYQILPFRLLVEM